MNTPYLNPLDIFGLASTPLGEITSSSLLKHKRRYLSEMELGGFEEFDVAGMAYVPSDLERAVDELKEEGMLEAQYFAAQHLSVVDFLIAGKLPPAEDVQHFSDSRLGPVLERYFAPLYNKAFLRAGQYADKDALQKLVEIAERTHLPEADLYAETYAYVSREVDRTVRAVRDKLNGKTNPDIREFSTSKMPEQNLSPALMSSLPFYFADQINKLADALIEYLALRGKKEQGYVLELVEYMADLPHLKPETFAQVKSLLPEVKKAKQNGVVTHQRELPGRSSFRTGLSIVLNIIVVIVLLLRVASCAS